MWDVRYRPLVFDDVLGQDGSTRVLRARLREGKAFQTSYIFAGGHGCGKTTLARIMARAMLCQALTAEGNPCNQCEHCLSCLNETMVAFHEQDAASQGTTADMRQLVQDIAYSIPGVEKRIYVLDEAHRMSKDAQDVLLKPVEDKKVVIIFCTTELTKIRTTISSRCEVYEIRKIDRQAILSRMQMVLQKEGVPYEDDAVLTVIDVAGGHVRDILNKLEMISQLGPITLDAVRERLNLSVVSTYYQVLLSLGTPSEAVRLVEEACGRVGPSEVAGGLAEAAMNSYRHANKIYADFSTFDRNLADKVHEVFGDSLPRLAQYFIRNSYISRLSLICDVVSLCDSGVPQTSTSTAPSSSPPVLVSAPVQVAPSVAAVQPHVVPAPATVDKAPPPESPPAVSPARTPSVPAPPRAEKRPPPPVTPVGTTQDDHKAVLPPPVRTARKGTSPKSPVVDDSKKTLTAAEFSVKLDHLRYQK